jgi:hypothetical protein
MCGSVSVAIRPHPAPPIGRRIMIAGLGAGNKIWGWGRRRAENLTIH